jgi:anion-transporting  ArsA/GET3 family ATPase
VDLGAVVNECPVRFVTGKGGVGKTTITAALALAAAQRGRRALIVEIEGRDELGRLFDADVSLTYEVTTLHHDSSGGEVAARHLDPEAALREWLGEHGFGRLLHRLHATGAMEVIATAVPGIKDVLVLGKIKALANQADADLLIVDAPATGHSLSLLSSPMQLAKAARSGPIRRQAEEAAALLADGDRCRVTLVTLPTELAVSEAVEAAYDLEDRAGVQLSAIVLNQFHADHDALKEPLSNSELAALDEQLRDGCARARAFTLAVDDEQDRQRARLAESLSLGLVVAAHVETNAMGFDRLRELVDQLETNS